MIRNAALLTSAVLLWATGAFGAPVHLDISSQFNYDIVVTDNELAYCLTNPRPNTPHDILGNHRPNYYDYTGTTLPADGMVSGGTYEFGKGLARRYDNVDGHPKLNNTVYRYNGSATVTLSPTQQQQYEDINFLFCGSRNSDSFSRGFTAEVEVKYEGDPTWHQLWYDEKSASQPNTVPGGSFGSAGVAGQGGFSNATDSDPTWALAHTVSGYVSGVASPPYPNTYNSPRYMRTFADNLQLDDTSVLEAFRLTTDGFGGSTRINNQFYLYAATANPIPEPASLLVLGIGTVLFLRRRTHA